MFSFIKIVHHWGKTPYKKRGENLKKRKTRLTVEELEPRRLMAIFTVTNVMDNGPGSFRAAITAANKIPNPLGGLDTINFSIGPGNQTITLNNSLPPVTDPVIIDGTSPAKFPTQKVILDGLKAGNSNGITITAGGSTVKGLVIINFEENGILLSQKGNNIVQNNYLGTNSTGEKAAANNCGIFVLNSSNNLIGGPGPNLGNLISGNETGIKIDGENSQDNIIQGNIIGPDILGKVAVSTDQKIGIRIFGDSSATTVGGKGLSSGNLISGNSGIGISIENSQNNIVASNYIGTDYDGVNPLGNGEGILIGGSNNAIGGQYDQFSNLISGNYLTGIHITGSTNFVQGNLIGTDVFGESPLPNGLSGKVAEDGTILADGITIDGLSGNNNQIGGSKGNGIGLGNIISGNKGNGITIKTVNNKVQGNYIGTDLNGKFSIPNDALPGMMNGAGVQIDFSRDGPGNNLIGGLTSDLGNIISGNGLSGTNVFGIRINGTKVDNEIRNASGNFVQGNFIGNNGTQSLPNSGGGVFLGSNTTGNFIGPGPGQMAGNIGSPPGNLISGNGGRGIEINGSGNFVQKNFVGTDITGKVGIPNSTGIFITGANNTIGGNLTGQGNLISGNIGTGVYIWPGPEIKFLTI